MILWLRRLARVEGRGCSLLPSVGRFGWGGSEGWRRQEELACSCFWSFLSFSPHTCDVWAGVAGTPGAWTVSPRPHVAFPYDLASYSKATWFREEQPRVNAGTYGCVGCRNQITDKKQLNAGRTYLGCGLSSTMGRKGKVPQLEGAWMACSFSRLGGRESKERPGVEEARRKVIDTVYKVPSC